MYIPNKKRISLKYSQFAFDDIIVKKTNQIYILHLSQNILTWSYYYKNKVKKQEKVVLTTNTCLLI